MAKVNVVMPLMGESVTEGTVSKWFKKVGDSVKRDEPLLEISTDKVDAEIPSPASGKIVEIKAKLGDTVPVNGLVAVIETSAEASAPSPKESKKREQEEAPAPAKKVKSKVVAPSKTVEERKPEAPRSSPLVRKIAEEHGVDLSEVTGSGVAGRITKDDILKFMESGAPSVAMPTARTETGEVAPRWEGEGRVHSEPMSVMRQKIAKHMVLSKQTSAHVTTVFEVDMTKIVAFREKTKDEFYKRNGIKLTYMPFIFQAVIAGLKEVPVVNASVDGNQIVYHRDINLGMAVALEWGLIVPVIKRSDELSIVGLARAANDLAERARSRKLKPEDVQGGTFTITNPGVFGSLFGTPIINQPQVGILDVGAIQKRPVVIENSIAIRSMVYLALSFDHRIVDGAVADQFMLVVKRNLESISPFGLA